MRAELLREKLHRQIDRLPDDLVKQVADFALFLQARNQAASDYENWGQEDWQRFSLEQLFREEDEVTYSVSEAKEVYHP